MVLVQLEPPSGKPGQQKMDCGKTHIELNCETPRQKSHLRYPFLSSAVA